MNDDEKHFEDEKDKDRAERMRGYRRKHWQKFRETRKRVQGTMTNEEYSEWQQRAEEAGRAVWTQIHAEATAHARGEYLPSKDVEKQISELIVQLRRLGNNVNQVTRTLNSSGEFKNADYVQNLEELETRICEFVKKPWGPLPDKDEPS